MFTPNLDAGRNIYVMMKMTTTMVYKPHLPMTMRAYQMKALCWILLQQLSYLRLWSSPKGDSSSLILIYWNSPHLCSVQMIIPTLLKGFEKQFPGWAALAILEKGEGHLVHYQR